MNIRAGVTKGFTLIELIVASSVILILVAILFSTLKSASRRAKQITCMDHLRQINLGLRMYSDDSADRAPHTPGTRRNPSLNWSGYKKLTRSYVGSGEKLSFNDALFACPADTFHYDSRTFAYLSNGLNVQSPDYSSYGFNGGNARVNSRDPGVAGLKLSQIREPTRTVLVVENSAFIPYSWHQPNPVARNGAPMFNDALNMVSFVDGHVSYIKIH